MIDVGDGLAVAFKVESHNHPSAVEPYQGAATGVGGILRDIFAMGARPIALVDSLRLGPLDEERPRELFRGIVRGIGGYGNCVGVPNVAGETVFDAAYRHNPLVNALCIGLLRADELVRASADGHRQPRRALRRHHRPRRHRRRERAGLAGPGRGRRGQAPERAGRRPVHGQEADRVHARAGRARPRRLGAGSRRGGPRLLDLRDGGERRRRHRARWSSRPRAAARAGHAAVRDHDLGVAGAHGRDRRARPRSPRSRPCARAGSCPCTAIGTVTDDGRLRCRYDGEVVGRHARRGARRRAALPAARRAARGPRRARARDRRGAARSPIRRALLLRPARRAQHLRQDVGLRAVRPGRRLGHRRRARAATRASCA